MHEKRITRVPAAAVAAAFTIAGVVGLLAAGDAGAVAHVDAHAHAHAHAAPIATAAADGAGAALHGALHHGVHLFLGAVGLLAAALRRGRTFLIGGGVVYLLIGAYALPGAIGDAGAALVEPLLHVGIGAAMASFAIVVGGAVPQLVPAFLRSHTGSVNR